MSSRMILIPAREYGKSDLNLSLGQYMSKTDKPQPDIYARDSWKHEIDGLNKDIARARPVVALIDAYNAIPSDSIFYDCELINAQEPTKEKITNHVCTVRRLIVELTRRIQEYTSAEEWRLNYSLSDCGATLDSYMKLTEQLDKLSSATARLAEVVEKVEVRDLDAEAAAAIAAAEVNEIAEPV